MAEPRDREILHDVIIFPAAAHHRGAAERFATLDSMVEAPLQFIKPPTSAEATVGKREPKPEWLKVRAPGSENYLPLRGIMRDLKLNTVCEDAHCPNIGECWHHGTATFMILGDICPRACTYCAVAHGKPATLDIDE